MKGVEVIPGEGKLTAQDMSSLLTVWSAVRILGRHLLVPKHLSVCPLVVAFFLTY